MTDKEKYLQAALELINLIYDMRTAKETYTLNLIPEYHLDECFCEVFLRTAYAEPKHIVTGELSTVIDSLKKRVEAAQEKRQKNKAIAEKRERAQYERLKAKFEGNGD